MQLDASDEEPIPECKEQNAKDVLPREAFIISVVTPREPAPLTVLKSDLQ